MKILFFGAVMCLCYVIQPYLPVCVHFVLIVTEFGVNVGQFTPTGATFAGFEGSIPIKNPSNPMTFLKFRPQPPYFGPLNTSETLLQCINYVLQCTARQGRMTNAHSNKSHSLYSFQTTVHRYEEL